MEYTADAAVKRAMVRAHAERGQVLRSFLTGVLASVRSRFDMVSIFRWA